MRRLLFGLTILIALAVAQPAVAATRTVTIHRSSFAPSSITIAFGDTVRWRNDDTITHQVVADNGTFASPLLRPGRTYSFTFRASGTYRYRDSIRGFRGTIVVRGAPPSISAGVSASRIVYGSSITVSGVVSNQRAGETVTLLTRP